WRKRGDLRSKKWAGSETRAQRRYIISQIALNKDKSGYRKTLSGVPFRLQCPLPGSQQSLEVGVGLNLWSFALDEGQRLVLAPARFGHQIRGGDCATEVHDGQAVDVDSPASPALVVDETDGPPQPVKVRLLSTLEDWLLEVGVERITVGLAAEVEHCPGAWW